jgi:murein DD-endopeptidase MepM/ murein hydrolase activator NlpD
LTYDKPMYLRGVHAPRRGGFNLLASAGFVIAIVVANWLVFFRSDATPQVTLDERLARPVEILPVDALQAPAEPRETPTTRSIEGTLARGETPAQALVRLGANPASAQAALNAAARHLDMRTLRAGQKIVAGLLPDGAVHTVTLPVDETTYVEASRDNDGFTARRQEIPTDKETVEFACVVRGSLYESLQRCGADLALAPVAADLLGAQVDFFTDSRRGDILRVIVDRETVGGRFLRYGRVHGMTYEGRLASASAFAVDQADGSVRYYDAEGNAAERTFLRSPLKYTRISSDFTLRRLHPILHTYTPHRAMDYAAPRGTPVYAVGDGRIVALGKKGAAGNTLVLQHEGGLQTYYAHLSSFAKGLKVGDKVARRTLIAAVGSTGRSTGPHLHFAVAKDGEFVHPRTLQTTRGQHLPEAQLNDFKARVGNLVGRLKALPVKGTDSTQS